MKKVLSLGIWYILIISLTVTYISFPCLKALSHSPSNPTTRQEIFFFGDSTAQYPPTEDTYIWRNLTIPSLLQKCLPNTQVHSWIVRGASSYYFKDVLKDVPTEALIIVTVNLLCFSDRWIESIRQRPLMKPYKDCFIEPEIHGINSAIFGYSVWATKHKAKEHEPSFTYTKADIAFSDLEVLVNLLNTRKQKVIFVVFPFRSDALSQVPLALLNRLRSKNCIDYSNYLPDNEFYDYNHLTVKGRIHLTNNINGLVVEASHHNQSNL